MEYSLYYMVELWHVITYGWILVILYGCNLYEVTNGF
jgi:hypothetical protein